jgi:hypothetical protein
VCLVETALSHNTLTLFFCPSSHRNFPFFFVLALFLQQQIITSIIWMEQFVLEWNYRKMQRWEETESKAGTTTDIAKNEEDSEIDSISTEESSDDE